LSSFFSSVQLVSLCVGLCFPHHVLDLVLVQSSTGLDDDLLLLASALVPGVHVDNAVGVDVEGDLNLGHTTWRRGDSSQLELSEELVVLCHLPLALVHLQLHLGLAIGSGGEPATSLWGLSCSC